MDISRLTYDEASSTMPNFVKMTLCEARKAYEKWVQTWDFEKKCEYFVQVVKHEVTSVVTIQSWAMKAMASGLNKKALILEKKYGGIK